MKKVILLALALALNACAPYYTSRYCFGPIAAPKHSPEAVAAYCEMPLASAR